MSLVFADRVAETTTTTGTGTVTLAGAKTGYQSFAAIADGNQCYYTIAGGSQWEVGIGTYTASGTTLSRDTVLSSSNSGSLVSFSAGSKDVFVDVPAANFPAYATLVEQHIATSGDATMDFTTGLSSRYDDYILEVVGFQPVTDQVNLWIRFATSGPTWDAGSNYKWGVNIITDGGGNTVPATTSSAQIALINGLGTISNGSSNSVDLTIYIKDPLGALFKRCYWMGHGMTSTNINGATGDGRWAQAGAMAGIRLMFNSGNIAAGTGRLYGKGKK